jgi:SAM-dependent methyltransferase
VNCQVCKGDTFLEVLDLGFLPLVNTLPDLNEVKNPDTSFELKVVQCRNCTLVQLNSFPSIEEIFPESYPYLSGLTAPLVANFEKQAEAVSHYFRTVSSEDSLRVLDIGSNDGSLLNCYKNRGDQVLGIEPTQAADVANSKGIKTLKSYFDMDSSNIALQYFETFDLVTATNVFAHIPDPLEILKNIEVLLSPGGVFLSENHYFIDLVNNLQIDTIYHEHLRYYTVTSLSKLFEIAGFEIFKVEKIESHGGSIRVWSARKGMHAVDKSVGLFLDEELTFGVSDGSYILPLNLEVHNWRDALKRNIIELKRSGSVIAAIGAPSRAVTLITYIGLNHDDLIGVGERTGSRKIGKRIPTTRIPIIDETEILSREPSHLLLLSWHLQDSLINTLREKGFKGKFIIPLPKPHEI